MGLDDLLKVVASGEDVEVFNLETHEMYHPFKEELPKEWYEYEVRHFYSLWNASEKETKTRIEVYEMEKSRLDGYISKRIKNKARFFALVHEVSMSKLIEDALVQLMTHHYLINDDSINYEYFTFDYPEGGFKNEVPASTGKADKLNEYYYGDEENEQN